jgi:cell division protein FtsB
MKSITVSVDDDTYRRARMKAAERDTSLSALVKQFLVDLAKDASELERLKLKEAALRASIRDFKASDRLSRDQMHERDR